MAKKKPLPTKKKKTTGRGSKTKAFSAKEVPWSKTSPEKLSDQQLRFCDEFMIDCNSARAAIRSGYSPDSAASLGCQLLDNPKIRYRIDILQERRRLRTNVTADKALAENALMAFSDIGDIIDFSGPTPVIKPADEIPEYARKCIQSIKVRRVWDKQEKQYVEIMDFKMYDKQAALNTTLKMLGLLRDKVEVSGSNGSPIQHDHVHRPGVVDIDVDKLPLPIVRALLEASRQRENVIDGTAEGGMVPVT